MNYKIPQEDNAVDEQDLFSQREAAIDTADRVAGGECTAVGYDRLRRAQYSSRYSDQVGGHGQSDNKEGMLLWPDDPTIILKPLSKKSKGCIERVFYVLQSQVSMHANRQVDLSLQSGECSAEELSKQDFCNPVPEVVRRKQLQYGYPPFLLRAQSQQGFQPEFLGIIKLVSPHTGKLQEYLVMRNEAIGFESANIVDIKIGKRSWDDVASMSKICKEQSKYSKQSDFGFRIVGMKYHDAHTQTRGQNGKEFGQSLRSDEDIDKAFTKFFNTRVDVVVRVHEYQNDLRRCMMERPSFQFFSSSQLILYGKRRAVVKQPQHGSQNEIPQQPGIRNSLHRRTCDDVRQLMIDFAHSYPFIVQDDQDYLVRRCGGLKMHSTGSGGAVDTVKQNRWELQRQCLPQPYHEWVEFQSSFELVHALEELLRDTGQCGNLHTQKWDENYLYGLDRQLYYTNRFTQQFTAADSVATSSTIDTGVLDDTVQTKALPSDPANQDSTKNVQIY